MARRKRTAQPSTIGGTALGATVAASAVLTPPHDTAGIVVLAVQLVIALIGIFRDEKRDKW